MRSCEHFQAQLLEHLFGLLDGEESLALIEHAGQCDDCRTALQQADVQKQLLSAAAKTEFSGVRFRAPTADELAASPRLPAPQAGWVRWAVAAAILLAVGIAVPGSKYAIDYVQQRRQVETASAQFDTFVKQEKELIQAREEARKKAHADFQAAEKKHKDLEAQQLKELLAARQALASSQIRMEVSGPETIRVDQRNLYKIRTRNRDDKPQPVQLAALVRDVTTNRVVFEQKDIKSNGEYDLYLSPDVAMKGGSALALEVVAATEGGARAELSEKLTLVKSSFVTQLVTDKPMYQPGETVHWRSLTLDRYSLKPPSEDFRIVYTLRGPKGDQIFTHIYRPELRHLDDKQVLGPDKLPVHGIGVGDWPIPNEIDGGEFTLLIEEQSKRFPPEKRKFIVNKYQLPRLNKELKNWHKPSYGPGEEVIANLHVEKVEGGVPIIAEEVIAIVRIDGVAHKANGEPVVGDPTGAEIHTRTDALGNAVIRFKLPAKIEKGQASLSATFSDGGGNFESLVKPIPVVVKRLNLEFYPEGGDLVAGVPNRVYLQARTMLDKPAQVKGAIVDDNGKVVVETVQTLHDPKEPGINQGMAQFSFKPEAGRKYELKIKEPAGIEGKFALPEPLADGVVMSVTPGVTTDKDPLKVTLHSAAHDRELLVGAYCRGRLLDYQQLEVKQGKPATVNLNPTGGMGGVYRVTVFEKLAQAAPGNSHLKPVAERLVYRKPVARLNLAVKPDKKQYAPGDPVKLDVTANKENGEAAPSVLLVAVVDKSVVKMFDERTARSLPTHFFLTTEVRRPEDLEFADVLLTEHRLASEALDLLLGTQGWRRFLESEPSRFKDKKGVPQEEKDDVDRLLYAMGKMSQDQQKQFTTWQLQQQRIVDKLKPDFDKVEVQLAESAELVTRLEHAQEFKAKKRELLDQAEDARSRYLGAAARLTEYDNFSKDLRDRALVVLGVLLLLAGLGSLAVGMTRSPARALPYYGTAIGAIAVCGLVLLATFFFEAQTSRQGSVALNDVHDAARKERAIQAPGVLAERDGVPGEDAADPQAPMPAADMPAGALKLPAEKRAAEKPQALLLKADEAGKGEGKQNGQGLPDRNRFGVIGGAALAPRAPLAAPGNGRPQPDAMKDGKEAQDRGDGALREQAAKKGDQGPGRGLGGDKAKAAMANQQAPAFAGVQAAAMPMPGLAGPANQPAARAQNGLNRAEDAALRRRGALQEEALEKAQKDMDARQDDKNPGYRAGERQLRQEERRKALMVALPQAEPCYIREYRHTRTESGDPEVRSDFTETLVWQPVLVLPQGKAEVNFDLCDSVGSFQVLVCGHTLDGRLGQFTTDIEVKKPFSLDAKFPAQVTANDIIDMPVAIDNATDEQKSIHLVLHTTGLTVLPGTQSAQDQMLSLQPGKRTRLIFRLKPSIVEGEATVMLKGSCEPFGTDTVKYSLKVVPDGFPTTEQFSDVLEKVAHHEVNLPKDWVGGTLKCDLQVYPSTLADLQKGLEGMLREPHGCFEQTSTCNYPNVLILNYLEESKQANPDLQKRARDLLTRGYGKLVSFECQVQNGRQGYEWFGGRAPAHEALTAYGLLQFKDMAKIGHPVDQAMVERTRQYLLSRKDGKGGFLRNTRALDTFGRAPDEITNAYIVWALTEAEDKDKPEDLDKEIAQLTTQAKDTKDPYFLALVANMLINRGKPEAMDMLKKLGTFQKPEGYLDGARTSITSSSGRTLQIETTALAVLAWVKMNRPQDFHQNLQPAIKWIGQQRDGGGAFGSTQSTILALKALLAFTKNQKRDMEAGKITLTVNGRAVAEADFTADLKETLTLKVPRAEEFFHAGKNEVEIGITGKSVLPYTLSWNYQAIKPLSAEGCPIRLQTTLDRVAVQDGDTVHMKVAVENTVNKGHGMVVAIVGIPAGLNLPENLEQLKLHARLRNNETEPGIISAFEVRGRELVLYWRQMAPNQKIEVDLDLICRVPGEYRGPASRAYLYYNADHKHWIDPIQVAVTPK